jgi:hypothetical protein
MELTSTALFYVYNYMYKIQFKEKSSQEKTAGKNQLKANANFFSRE